MLKYEQIKTLSWKNKESPNQITLSIWTFLGTAHKIILLYKLKNM